jgi:hypothetical protein
MRSIREFLRHTCDEAIWAAWLYFPRSLISASLMEAQNIVISDRRSFNASAASLPGPEGRTLHRPQPRSRPARLSGGFHFRIQRTKLHALRAFSN